ncbi:MAG: leucine-rich repeat domain-containing protein [Promethearchaeia archaeon]
MESSDIDLIIEKYKNEELDYTHLINLLISLIQTSDDRNIRSQSINLLKEFDAFNMNLFKFIENLIISEADCFIKRKAINILGKYYKKFALKPLKWAIKYERDYDCLISLIKALIKIEDREIKEFLILELREKINQNKEEINNIGIQKYNYAIQQLYQKEIIRNFNPIQIANILISYITISELIKRFYSVYYELDQKTCLPIKLDLSDIEFEVRGWKSEFKNEIRKISDITGLNNLQSLEFLDLSNNLIQDIQKLSKLKNLKYLFLSNNKIKNIENITFLKKIKSLQYLDISGNNIAQSINNKQINNKVEIKVHNLNYFR